MITDEHLKALFRCFGDRNDIAFMKAAEAIIAGELAANHHALANDLQKALSSHRTAFKEPGARNGLASLPKDRRNGEELIALQGSSVSQEMVILSKEPKAKINRILEEHRNRSLLSKNGYSPKTKILFWGPPGCGKTYTAFYLAHELGLQVGILRLNAVISSFLGDTASHVQRIFDMASKSPMVLLLDEIDSIGKNRDDPNDVGELKRIVNSLLQAIDSFQAHDSIIVAASNHQYLLDPAIWRRFDDIVQFPMPELSDRERYLKLLLNGVQFNGSFANIARLLSQLSYADIERIIVEAVKTMILEGRSAIQSKDITFQYRTLKSSVSEAQRSIRTPRGRGGKR